MTDEGERSFRGARFDGVDFIGATFRECLMNEVRIIGSVISGLHITGFAGDIERVVVNEVDVTAYVQGELDRRHPERVQLRAVRTADDFRAMWATVERLWTEVAAEVAQLPDATLHARVDGEWSFVETLRHLVFATDVWLGRMVLDGTHPFHRLGLPPTDYPTEDSAALGLEIDARPSYDEVMAVRAGRCTQMRELLATITDDELAVARTAEPAPGWGVETRSVAQCLRVVLREECEHRRYVLRDLAALGAVERPRP